MGHHVIYIPGIGDRVSYGQNIAVRLWRFFGLAPHYMPLGWRNHEGIDAKLSRLLEYVIKLEKQGNKVSLVGTSAGASVVLNAFAAHKSIARVVCVSGKINRPETIGPKYYDENPDFKESMNRVAKSLASLGANERGRVMSTHPWRDSLVPIEDTIIPGAKEKTLPGWGHVSGIFFALTYGAPAITRYIKSGR